jgi:hypothetical protein
MVRRNWVLFAIILAAAICLRFYGLIEQGFLYWDEGMYMNEAKFYSSLVEHRAFILEQVRKGPDIEMIEAAIDGWPPSAVKPLHGLLIYGMSLVIGLHDYTGQVTSAFFSIIMLLLVFFMVAKYESLFTAFFALILLTFSPFHIMFARAAFPEMDSVVFYLIATLFYLAYIEGGRRSIWKMLGVGVFFGLALTANYRWFMMIPVFFIAEIFIKEDPFLQRLRRCLVMFAGFMVVVLAMDIPYKLFLAADTVPVEFASFKEQLLYYVFKIFSEHQLALFGFRPLYLRLYYEFNGLISTGFLLLGTALLLRKRRTFLMNYSLLVFYFVLLGLTFVRKGQFARYDSIIYPFGAIITAYGITGFCKVMAQRRWLRNASVTVLALFIIVSGIKEARAIISLRSGYREAKAFLEEHGGEKCLASTNSVFEFYFGRNVANILNRDENSFIEDMQKDDYKFLVVDYAQMSVVAGGPTHIYSYLREHKKPVAVIKNPMGAYLRAVLENIHYADNPLRPYAELLHDPQIDEIRIYSTEGLVDEIKAEISARQG